MQSFMLGVLFSFALIAAGPAGTHKLPDEENPIATITIPEDWKTDDYDEGVEATSDDGEVYLAVETTDAKEVKEAMTEAMEYLEKKGVTVEEDSARQKEGKLNGMDVVDVSWDGKDEEGDARISLTVVSITEENGLLLIYWASPEGEKKHDAELKKIARSIKKAGK